MAFSNSKSVNGQLIKHLDKDVKKFPSVIEKAIAQRVDNFSDIDLNKDRSERFIRVKDDETNGGISTLYYFDGEDLNWVVTQKV